MNLKEKDWILENIRVVLKSSQYDNTSLARAIGVSAGELSKILNGERLNYHKYIPAIAEYLNVPFLRLVSNGSAAVNNYADGNTHATNNNDKSAELYERLVKEMNERIARLELHLKEKDETIAYLKGKNARLKMQIGGPLVTK